MCRRDENFGRAIEGREAPKFAAPSAGLPSRRKVFARLIGHSTQRPHTLPLSGRSGPLRMLPFFGGAFLQGRNSNWKIIPNSDSYNLERRITSFRTNQTTDRSRNGPPTSIKSSGSVFCLQIHRSPALCLFIFSSANRDRSSRRSRRASSSSATTTHTRRSHKIGDGEILDDNNDDNNNQLPGHTTGTTTSFRRARRGTFPRGGRRKAIWRRHHRHHRQCQCQYHRI